jgi:AAA domain
MNIGNELVTHVIKRGDIEKFSSVPTDSPVIFQLEDARAWKLISEHHDKHGVVMSEDLFLANFPAYMFAPGDYTAGELLEEASRQHTGFEIAERVSHIIDAHDDGDFDKAEKLLSSYKPSALVTPLKILTRSELRNLPKPESLIAGVLDKGTVGMLNGFRGTSKSFLALDWTCSVAAGIDWMGHRTDQERVLYVAAEGGYGQSSRVDAWEVEHDTQLDDDLFHLYPQPVQFADPDQAAKLRDLVSTQAYGLIVIDTLARSTVGLEENSARDMGLFVDELYRLRDALGRAETTILVVHHTGYQQGRARGSSSLEAAMDAVYTVSCPGGENPCPHEQVKLVNTKQKDRAQHDDIYLKLVPRAGGAVLVGADTDDVDRGDERMILDYLGRNLDSTVQQVAEAMNRDRSTATKRLNKLLTEEKVTRAVIGKTGFWSLKS